MKNTVYVLIIFSIYQSLSFAQVLLLPNQNISYTNYLIQCQKPGYECIQKFYFDEIKKTNSPLLNSFFEKLDYQSELFVNQSYALILDILKNEQISLDELDSLIEFSSKIAELQKKNSYDFKILKNKLIDLKKIIFSSKINSASDNFIVIFKTAIELDLEQELKEKELNIFIQKISYNKNLNNEFLVNGSCENTEINLEKKFKSKTWTTYGNESCNLSENLNTITNKTLTKINENKTILFSLGLALSAALIANKYDVEFTF